jgi:carbonic anhydrase
MHRRAHSRRLVAALGLVSALVLVACGGGGDDAAASETSTEATTEGSTPGVTALEVEHVTDDHATSGHTVTKEQFDELKLQVLELEVEVDKLQVLAGLDTEGEVPEAEEAEGEEAAHGDAPHWTYEEAARWQELSEEFSACGEGTQQSPIDLTGAVGLDLPNAILDYVPADATVIDNGHTVQVNVPEAGTLELDGKTYAFAQFHFHAPSEHTVEGDHWPMEWHFVHKAEDGSLAVLGVLVEEGPAWQPFDIIIESLPLEENIEDKVYGQVDIAAFLPELTAAYRYDGSLTTPPCSEGVEWSVLQGTITMSIEQMEAFTSRFSEANNRPVQPVNDRELEKDVSA